MKIHFSVKFVGRVQSVIVMATKSCVKGYIRVSATVDHQFEQEANTVLDVLYSLFSSYTFM